MSGNIKKKSLQILYQGTISLFEYKYRLSFVVYIALN